ncbi:hypothetical protein O6H91_06G058100 [Diphasiastrum complanatum]|uniref:Uncharacterized protein n=1 Tax=Diphasiastrum complanatum TaxID=34168 RepID=A0ACC2DE28_DIPCM|nr:hypothetical protein O6H91_06G058100 [Diphasiastrum complanatum]
MRFIDMFLKSSIQFQFLASRYSLSIYYVLSRWMFYNPMRGQVWHAVSRVDWRPKDTKLLNVAFNSPLLGQRSMEVDLLNLSHYLHIVKPVLVKLLVCLLSEGGWIIGRSKCATMWIGRWNLLHTLSHRSRIWSMLQTQAMDCTDNIV